ncbi:hypothetical protein [Rhodanobacter terrae]|uniref:Reverse transcriptase (RNA-dependent DNA polymerase) n=1 Tax=Rhodanobacter terrae TaxID=418647 RepID=A0ABW0SZD7_9GAMM
MGSRIVTYADDLLILCRQGRAEDALFRLRDIMGKMKLSVDEEKTHPSTPLFVQRVAPSFRAANSSSSVAFHVA